MLSLFAGLGLGLSLIVAIGAQNVFILRQGIRREHVLAVIVICALSDAVLIVAGVAGLGYLLESVPWLVDIARALGAAFLLCYALLAARRAWQGTGDAMRVRDAERQDAAGPLLPVVLTVLALTWLNPHVYLDTVLMLGSIAATHGDARWIFAAGAIIASCVWFVALGYGARYLSRWLNTPGAWRVLDGVISIIMIVIAVTLVVPIFAGG